MDDNDLSFIMASTRRQDILLLLYQKKMTVTEVASKTHIPRTSLYTTFKNLADKGFITSNRVRKFKVFHITEKGIEVLKYFGVI